jgi:hypothetical protein
MRNTILISVTCAFAILTSLALWHHGYWGIVAPHFQSFGAGQVFADLVIALSLAMAWMLSDAKKTGRNPVGWILLTLTFGSFGPLIYLITRKQTHAR